MIRCLVFFCVLAGVLGSRAARAEGCVQPDELRHTDTPYSLWGKCLQFTPLSVGSRIPLGSIVYFPLKEQGGSLTISVDRSAVTERLVKDLFDRPDDRILATHHLAQRGLALVLTPTRLKLTVYPSVIVSLRSDIPSDPAYRSFLGQPTFVVDQIQGKAFASTDLKSISNTFFDVYVQYVMRATATATKVLPDGSTRGFANLEDPLPTRQLPSKALE